MVLGLRGRERRRVGERPDRVRERVGRKAEGWQEEEQEGGKKGGHMEREGNMEREGTWKGRVHGKGGYMGREGTWEGGVHGKGSRRERGREGMHKGGKEGQYMERKGGKEIKGGYVKRKRRKKGG